MSEFQKPYSAAVTEESYRRIFRPYLSCQGCHFSWKSKDAPPCLACVRVPAALAFEFEGEKKDLFTKLFIADMNNPEHFNHSHC